jgi:hypothetical protein
MSQNCWGRSLVLAVVVFSTDLFAAGSVEPGWTSRALVPVEEQAVRQATPLVDRPYRPLHFYGNTVRRIHYHGRVRPTLPEVRQGMHAWATRG